MFHLSSSLLRRSCAFSHVLRHASRVSAKPAKLCGPPPVPGFEIDEEFRMRMLAPELKAKKGRFYIVDPPVAGYVANVVKPFVKDKFCIHASPGPGVLTLALDAVAEVKELRVMDNRGLFLGVFEHLQESKLPTLKAFHGNIAKVTPNALGDEDAEDYDSLEMSVFPTFGEVLDGIPETPWNEEAQFAIVAPFGADMLPFLGILLPHVCGKSGWFSRGRCSIIGAVSCLIDDPVLLGSAPSNHKLSYYNALIEQVFDVELLCELPVDHGACKIAPIGVHRGKNVCIRVFSFTPKLEHPDVFDLALYRVIYPQSLLLDSPIFDHIKSHGITEEFCKKIMDFADLPEDLTARNLMPDAAWKLFLGYKRYCDRDFLEKLFFRLAVVKYDDNFDAFRSVEMEEQRRFMKDYGRGLDNSFWDDKSGRFRASNAPVEHDMDALFEGDHDTTG